MIGTTLKDRYIIEERIGAGAMGEVYRAHDQQSGDWVAIKRMSADLANDPNYRKRFGREVQALRRLQHPHIVGYIDAFALGGNGFLVTEFFSGGNLGDLIRSRGSLPEGLFKRIALQVLDAVATAHEAGIIHRDLKPDNVLLSATGEPKVADFGLARAEDMSTMTQTGAVMGTLAYMPPEAFEHYVRPDHRADIWALGVVLFQMLTAQYPFKARSQSAMIAAILNDDPTPLSHYRHDLPGAWEMIIQHCLQKEPTQRYPSVRDLMRDLQADRFTAYGNAPPAGTVVAADGESEYASWLDQIDPFADLELENQAGRGYSQTQVMPPAGAKSSDYQLRFVQPEAATPIPRPQPAQTSAKRSTHAIHYVDDDQISGMAANLMIFGGIFQWVGLFGMIISGLVILAFWMGSADSDEIALIPVLVTLGGICFGVGLVFELPSARTDNERFTLLGLGVAGGITWLLLFFGALQFSISIFLGVASALGLALYFFAAKSA
ncbi:MAG: serine/threonine-protein kinase [Anaerolineales bacterium]